MIMIYASYDYYEDYKVKPYKTLREAKFGLADIIYLLL